MPNAFSGQTLLFGIAAGLLSALLAGSVLTQTSLSVILFLASALPIIAAGIAFGATASIIAAAVCTLAVATGVQPLSGLVVGATAAVPAAFAAWFAGLARPAEEVGGKPGDVVWFPIADIMFRCGVIIALGFILVGTVVGYNPDYATRFAELFQEQFAAVNPDFQPTDEFVPSFASFIYSAVPVIQPALMLGALMFNLYAALGLLRANGMAPRPRDDWPTALRQPRIAVPVFGVAILLSFLSGPIGLIGLVFTGAMGIGFVLGGFAVMHLRTRGKAGRGLILTLAYLGVVLFAPVVVLFLMIGLFDTARAAPVSGGGTST